MSKFDNIPALVWLHWEKLQNTPVGISDIRADIWTRNLPNIKSASHLTMKLAQFP